MAASDHNPHSDRASTALAECLDASALVVRLDEEIGRAERHDTPLSCLLVVIDNLDEIGREHGTGLREQTLAYVIDALRRELRRFDRVGRPAGHELAIVLPGADSPSAEMVARRTLERLRAIKIEADGQRQPLEISVGLASWRQPASAETLLETARSALCNINGDNGQAPPAAPPAPAAPPTS
jgi:diguanylate cyclase (GGDEF)-like protein